MKNKLIANIFYCTVIGASTMFAGCSKSFLNDPQPSSALGPGDIYTSDQGVRAYFNGIYSYLRTQYGGNGTIGGSTDAWGIVSVNLAREAKGVDVPLNGNWYGFDYQQANREPTFRRTVFTWRFFYELINQVNNLIDGVQKSTALVPASKAAFLAEGKAFRAWCYFELVREFCHAYAENPNGPGIPIYTEPTTASTPGKPRGKISDVYTFILKDLNDAVGSIPTARQMKDVINQTVVNGLLARVYLETGDWNNASKFAQAARAGYALNAADYNTPMTDITKPEVMWGFPQSSDQSIYYGSPSAFWSASGAYNNFFIDSTFVPRFKATDIRSKTFYQTSFTDFRKWRTNKFGTKLNFTDNIVMMRVAEMYLIEAEAKARLNDPGAGDVLLQLQKNRDPQAVASGNTGTALINEILLERRKELYGEIGVSFLDVKRCQLPLQRGVGHVVAYRFNFPANDNRLTLKIPQTEFDANTSLTTADQNP